MPTGYTHGVADGTVTDFTEYAQTCARAFGACVMLRDEPIGPEIPEFEPSDTYAKWIDIAQAKIAELESMSPDQLRAAQIKERDDAIESNERSRRERDIKRKRYELMLTQARAYTPPTKDHEEFAKFLVSQLEESIAFDCSEHEWSVPPLVPVETWLQENLTSLKDDIQRYEKLHRDEVRRTAERNKWVRDLKESLKQFAKDSEATV